ncbi:TolB family protein [Falsihalocynthiibacter sp. SS001]|uniref:TolB family protein n=1 Tax=Falsihalocynthiibacter sp. SS001 TaxID=3349698 RepID=UPI0036D33E23
MKSELMIHDLASGKDSLLLRLDGHIEAPNWRPDGGGLVVNGDGKLYDVPLDAPELRPIDTGFAKKLNNDHGISPDGSLLAISDQTETGESTIYTLPIGGGTPARVTEKTPSYWHGWSPDGASLTYTANRGEGYQIHTIGVTGGEETQVTRGFDHCDGPDYTADGAWIWFNGEKRGSVQLWRVRPNGSDIEQMTDEKSVNWFPHPSPDGRHILYLAYPLGTQGHPAGKNVELRLMPTEGGKSRALTTLFGGQGTINVPCWAPDSSKFAFMRYVLLRPSH